ncbi:hypothetical protein GCM10009753_60250 [Streptantibioticus ferralitis]
MQALPGGSLRALSAGFAVLAVVPEPTTYPGVAVVLAALGIGDGLAVTTGAAVMLSAVPAARAGQAGAVSEACYELGVGLGVALLGSIHAAIYHNRFPQLPLHGSHLETAPQSVGGAAEVARQVGGAAGAAVLAAARSTARSPPPRTSRPASCSPPYSPPFWYRAASR